MAQTSPVFGEPARWVETTGYLLMTPVMQLIWWAHDSQVGRETAQTEEAASPSGAVY
jgi:hypothetical protein